MKIEKLLHNPVRLFLGMFLVSFIIGGLITACSVNNREDKEAVDYVEPEIRATVIIYMPDGTIEVHDAIDVTLYNDNTRCYWTEKDDINHVTTLPYSVDYK